MEPQKNISINCLYFGFFLAVLLTTSTCSILLKEDTYSRFFFWIYAVLQAFIEISFFIFAGWLLQCFSRKLFWAFIGFTFICLLLHVLDFFVDRVLDLSVFRTINIFVFGDSFQNFIYLLEASGIPLWLWAIFFGFILIIPALGIVFYKTLNHLGRKKTLTLRPETGLQILLCLPVALLFWDFSAHRVISPNAYTTFVKSLPWNTTILQPTTVFLQTPTFLAPPPDESAIRLKIESTPTSSAHKPNIYLFVTESLRQDFITPDIAPNLSLFREQNIQADLALSNANATNISWFSIFHSQFPFYWHKLKEANWSLGSPALALFKKFGYKIRLYTSAELRYYGLEELMFGTDHHLIDSYQSFPHTSSNPPFEADRQAVLAMNRDLLNPELQQGQIFLIFWDATHFDYSWPKKPSSKFTPFAGDLTYFQAYCSKKNIEEIKNRYRNAIHCMDSLFGECTKNLPKDSIIAFTGDHGEEFFEHGHLFHLSHLVHEQISVPLYFKIPGHQKKLPFLTHLDIMPTLLDASLHITVPFLQGESALRPKQWPYTAIARFNANRTPYEFCLHNTKNKLILQFSNHNDIFATKDLRIISLQKCKDGDSGCQKEFAQWIGNEFSPALNRLFPLN